MICLDVKNFIVAVSILTVGAACVEGGGTVDVTPKEEGVTVISQTPTRVGERAKPASTPVPPDPGSVQPNIPSQPTSIPSSGTSVNGINNVSTYCSNDLVGWSESSMASVKELKFTFFQKNRMNFYERTEWNKFTSAIELKSSLMQKKAVLPLFTSIPDGDWEVLVCDEKDMNCAFFAIFGPFSLYHSIVLGQGTGIVGAMEITLQSGKVTASTYAEFLYPLNPQGVSCDESK